MKQLRRRIDLDSLSPRKARIEICKDVIAALDASIITAASLIYLEIQSPEIPRVPYKKFPAQSLFPTMTECRVCALGAVFVATAGRNSAIQVAVDYNERGVHMDHEVDQLKPYFSESLLRDIEAEFEGFQDKHKYFDRYPDATERMKAIMQSVIDHDRV